MACITCSDVPATTELVTFVVAFFAVVFLVVVFFVLDAVVFACLLYTSDAADEL